MTEHASDEHAAEEGGGKDSPAYTSPDLALLGAEHVRRYLETGGAVGHAWNGVTCLVLWTVGRRTGQRRATPLIYGRDGDNYVVIASQGGLPAHPGWYHNLVAEPRVEAQVLADRFEARARVAEGEERERLWKIMAASWPNYDEYVRRTSRRIPVVVLERA
ncbi:nitroreductase family deazaflavin-dependent oxidoreductase [Frankia sp. CNm7]|uniref:Nitroreductase family deazaflavin-dependent oxidoreductase n=1 Tax=Frankia nepalensis TaxID=1836974 RepID=A0A937R7X2_9ACTN|nr:nitroreductase family deazaflavin-dependent oxidoreductase [Frankia nepalensis]MBL7496382.1 nitroreductase family deazaflavin-dependent oxidoreductase [Frankia nepalensis]MBL7511468.1 nitroreductase family deazaflavin-dependent oxidoreductase [Frankia nepalensis]MBL7523874.1 nitroreductase family deazaflavin-dependent oxidoreductase [Frankia nepalensis]MBL7627333.1 nitroreductase family deazaflavin-dependent oxidoreductase [Frankia nepalensis]